MYSGDCMTLGPLDQLEPGTKIRVKNRIGTIINAKTVPAVPSGMIVVHTVCMTTLRVRGFGTEYRLVPIKNPVYQTVNNAFIEVLE